MPAADGTGPEDDHGIAQPDVEDLDTVEGAGKRVRDRRQVRGEVRRQWDDVFHRDGGHRRVLSVRTRKRVVAIEQVMVAEILKALGAPAAFAARQDRAEKNPIALLYARRQLSRGTDVFDDAHRFVPKDPRSRRLRVAVEEGPGVSAADAAGLDP